MEVPLFMDQLVPEAAKADIYLKLNKALYRLKQAPRAWFKIIKKFFQELGIKSLDADLNLFIKDQVYIFLYINNMLIIRGRD